MAVESEVAAIYKKLGPWINRFKGGAPGGFIAAAIQHESGGRMDAPGDVSLSEAGYLQVTDSFPKSIGVSPDVRLDPEGNIWLGSLEYNLLAAQLKAWAPELIKLGSPDNWKLARLSFAVGVSGTRTLIKNATGMNPTFYGQVYPAIVAYVDRVGGLSLGSQSTEKVKARVHAVEDQWAIGTKLTPSWGKPQKVPSPSGLPYTISANLLPYLSSPMMVGSGILILGGMAAIAYFVWKRTKE